MKVQQMTAGPNFILNQYFILFYFTLFYLLYLLFTLFTLFYFILNQ